MTLQNEIDELGIKVYRHTIEEDDLITDLWKDLRVMDEIENLVAQSAQNLSGFFSILNTPNAAFYTCLPGMLESLHWVEPVTTSQNAVFFSSWWDPRTRGTKRHTMVMSTIYQLIFATGKQTILGVTKQEKLLNLHRKIGYCIQEPIPDLFDDQPGWIMHLTHAAFKVGVLYRAAQRAWRSRKEELNVAA